MMIHIFQRHTVVISVAEPLYESLFCVTTYLYAAVLSLCRIFLSINIQIRIKRGTQTNSSTSS